MLYLTRSSGKKGMDSERLSDDVDEDNVNSGARREAVMGVKTAFVKAVGHYSGSLSPDSGAERDHLSVFFHPCPGYPGWDYNQDGHHERDGQSFSPPFLLRKL